jgi:large subunit ribosomal protein L16
MPKRTKHRKTHRGRVRGEAHRGNYVSFGQYGIQALESAWITSRQIESARVVLTRRLQKGGKLWIRIFPDKPVTAKPAETRMGKGKGEPQFWVAVVKRGKVMFEFEGIPDELAKEVCYVVSQKMPIQVRLVTRDKF